MSGFAWLKGLLSAVATGLGLAAAAQGLSEYVPVDWTCASKDEQVKTIRKLHDEYGFRRFALIGPFLKDTFDGSTLKDFEELGDSLAWARQQLADRPDVELGWWLVPTLRMNGGKGAEPIVNGDGTVAAGNCPLSPTFTADLKAKVAACVKRGRPRVIFVEDDYTVSNCAGLAPMGGCFCPHHLKACAARTGRTHTGAEIASSFERPTAENRPLREAFARATRDSLATLAGEVRQAIDAVDPTVRVCLCQSGFCDLDGDFTEAVARAFAGRTRPMVRICGASYMNESVALSLPGTTAHLFWSAQHLPDDFELIHETDPYPHTRFYASSRFLGSELVAGLMAGACGSYYYCAPYTDAPLEDDGYAAWMRENRPRLAAVNAARQAMKPCGVRIVYTPAEVYLRRGRLRQGAFGGLPAAARFLAQMGVPYTTSEGAASVLFGDTAEILSDDEIRALLKGGVLLDGEAAVILTRRGFASLIGCTAEAMPADVGFAREEIQPIAGCTAKGRRLFVQRAPRPVAAGDRPPFAGQALLKPQAGTGVWSRLVGLGGRDVAPSVTFCRNALGGRVGVMYLSPSYGCGFNGATFHFRKQELVHRLFAKLSEGTLDVAAPKTPSSWTLSARNDEELLVMVENLGGEPRKDAELAFSAKWRGGRIARLDANGAWEDVGTAGERHRVAEEDYQPQKPAFFKVSLKRETGFRPWDVVSETSLATEMLSAFPKIRKLGATSPYGEVSPFVFRGRLMRLELIDPSRGLNAAGQEIGAGIRDVATGKILSTFGKDCYYFSAFCEDGKVLVTGTERQNGGYAGDTIWAFESTDLVSWSRRRLLTNPGWRYFNTSLTKGRDGYVLLLESAAPKYATRNFTMFFATSKDLKSWSFMPYDVCFPKRRYAGGPFIRHHNGFYYVSLVTELPNERYVTYLYRTADFRRWECGRYNPLVAYSQEDRQVSPTASEISESFAREVRTRFICNASDLEMCDFEGKTYLSYVVGDQRGFYYICEAWYDGPMGELLENFFR